MGIAVYKPRNVKEKGRSLSALFNKNVCSSFPRSTEFNS